MGLKFKLMIGVVIFGILAGVGTFSVLYTQKKVSDEYQSISHDTFPKVALLNRMLASFRRVRIDVRSMPIKGNNDSDIKKYIDDAMKSIAEFEQVKSELESYHFDQKGQHYLELVDTHWKDFFAFGGRMVSLATSESWKDRQKMEKEIREICPVKAALVVDNITELLKHQDVLFNKVLVSAEEKAHFAQVSAFSISIGLFVLMLTLGLHYSRKISSELEMVIEKLSSSAKLVGSAGHDFNEHSKDLSRSSDANFKSMDATAKRTEDVSDSVSKNTELAASGSDKVKDAVRRVERSQDLMASLRNSIDEITGSKATIEARISDQSREFEKIVGLFEEIDSKTQVINEIVFQTKLLSFNASVEAARAGDHGKGFAVVAEEVGSLAAMSGNAAEEIRSLLDDSKNQVTSITKETSEQLAQALAKTAANVADCESKSEECGHAFSDLSQGIRSLNEIITSVASSAERQQEGLSDISASLKTTKDDTQSNLKLSNQIASKGEHLNTEAENLNRLSIQLNQLVLGQKTPSPRAEKMRSATDLEENVVSLNSHSKKTNVRAS